MLELKNLRDLPEVNWVRISDQVLKKAFASAAQPRRRIIGKQSEGRLAMTRVKRTHEEQADNGSDANQLCAKPSCQEMRTKNPAGTSEPTTH